MSNIAEEKKDFDQNDVNDLLRECLHFFNMIPRKAVTGSNAKDTYELCTFIENYLYNKGEKL